MAFETADVLREAVRKTVSRTGLAIVAAFIALQVVSFVGYQSLVIDAYAWFVDWMVQQDHALEGEFDEPAEIFRFAVDIPWWAAIGLIATTIVGSVLIMLGAFRAFIPEQTRPLGVSLFTERVGWVWLNLFVGGIVFTVLWFVGLVLLFIPGIVFFVLFVYWFAFVADEHVSFPTGMRRSVGLTRGHRWDVFALFLVYWLVYIVFFVAYGIVELISPIVGQLMLFVVSSVGSVYLWALIAISYRHLVAVEGSEAITDDEAQLEEFAPN